jgi:hypothetical protein
VSAYTLAELCSLMHRYGLTRIKHGTTELERPAFTVAVPEGAEAKPAVDEEERDELERLKAMSPDAQDRALMLNGAIP